MTIRRELWMAGTTMISAIKTLNSLFRSDGKEHEVSDDDIAMVAEMINSECSVLMKEDVFDVLRMINALPEDRYCPKTDCMFHHPEDCSKHSFDIYQEKCGECGHNTKVIEPLLDRFEPK